MERNADVRGGGVKATTAVGIVMSSTAMRAKAMVVIVTAATAYLIEEEWTIIVPESKISEINKLFLRKCYTLESERELHRTRE